MSQAPSHQRGCSSAARTPDKIEAALRLLVEARDYARDTQCDAWHFAVEIATLQAAGLTPNEARWLIRKGYVEHARETTTGAAVARQFRRSNSHAFYKRSCFILTESGLAFACQIATHSPASHDLPEISPRASHDGHGCSRRPHWDAELRELYVDGQLVKRYKSPAPNQIAILSAFEEDGWPRHVDDPLPRSADLEEDPKRRLNDTVKSLNRHHHVRVIHFSTDGTGEGVRWEWIAGAPGRGGK